MYFLKQEEQKTTFEEKVKTQGKQNNISQCSYLTGIYIGSGSSEVNKLTCIIVRNQV
jgi:hypothetical protein